MFRIPRVLDRPARSALLTTVLAVAAVVPAAEADVALRAEFTGGGLRACHAPVTGGFTVQGPGVLTTRLTIIDYLNPYGVATIVTQLAHRVPPESEFHGWLNLPAQPGPGFICQWGHKVDRIEGGYPVELWGSLIFADSEPHRVDLQVTPLCAMTAARFDDGAPVYYEHNQEYIYEAWASEGLTLQTDGPPSERPASDCAPYVEPAPPTAEIFSNLNIDSVWNGPTSPTLFTLAGPVTVTSITTYHWNMGNGAPPGQIWLQDASGQVFGPWPARGEPGMGGRPNAMWVATPNAELPPGTYRILDSDPATWSHNPTSGGAGIAWVKGG